MLELLAPVVGFGGGGQDFDDHQRVEQDILFVIGELLLPASYHEVGISEQARSRYLHPHVTGVDVARTIPQLDIERRHQIGNYPVVPPASSRHREHLALVKLAPELSLSLDGEIPFFGQQRFRIRRHYSSSTLTVCS